MNECTKATINCEDCHLTYNIREYDYHECADSLLHVLLEEENDQGEYSFEDF
jgi:hypothetical protein